MNHKRKRPKDRRAGCLLRKPWKSNCLKGRRRSATKSGTWRGLTRHQIRANVSAKEQGAL